jgi:hypothetical protein
MTRFQEMLNELMKEPKESPKEKMSGSIAHLLEGITREILFIEMMLALESSDKHIRAWGQMKANDGSMPGGIIGLERKIEGLLVSAEQQQVRVLLRCPKCRKTMSASVQEYIRLRELYPEKVGPPHLELDPKPDWPHPHSCQL